MSFDGRVRRIRHPCRMSDRFCFVVGARPNFMKAAPILRALRSAAPWAEPLLVHTGQHYDATMSDVFLDELELPAPDVFLGVGSGSHAEQTARALVGIEAVLVEHQPALVVVSGDVNSTLAGALAAVKLGIPVAHVEAGLRSFDPAMPEEHNRRLTDHVSAVLLAHSQDAVDNLADEGIERGVHLVGNTMVDSLRAHVEAARAAAPWSTFGLAAREYGLVTLHRPGLVDDPELLRAAVDALVTLAESVPLLFPAHPRTVERLAAAGLRDTVERSSVVLAPPLGYLDFLGLEAEAQFVLTDSGGVQEETSALGVPCFTLRDRTERPVTVELGTNTVIGLSPARIAEIPALIEESRPGVPIPLWDGQAGERAATVLAAFVGEPVTAA
jgi:UDP-N-acetylglucosamine 2-epimerase (non-hydrolysing)